MVEFALAGDSEMKRLTIARPEPWKAIALDADVRNDHVADLAAKGNTKNKAAVDIAHYRLTNRYVADPQFIPLTELYSRRGGREVTIRYYHILAPAE